MKFFSSETKYSLIELSTYVCEHWQLYFLLSDNFAITLIRPAFSSRSRMLSSFNFVKVA